MVNYFGLALALLAIPASAGAATDDAAAKFGARDAIEGASLSPDGKSIAIVRPVDGRGSALLVAKVGDPEPKVVFGASGSPDHLRGCAWSTNTRLICTIYVIQDEAGTPTAYTRLFTLDASGKNVKLLSARKTSNALGTAFSGGDVIDWQVAGDGTVLMTNNYVPESTTGTITASSREGLGVDRVNTTTLARTMVEAPRPNATDYIADGRGKVRIMGVGVQHGASEYESGTTDYFYRKADSREWLKLGAVTYNGVADVGFEPLAVDPDLNVVYGLDAAGGHTALYKIALDGSMKKELVFDRPDVDVEDLVQVGRQHRVVGVGYSGERRHTEFFDPQLKAFSASLSKALPKQPLVSFVDASADEKTLLLWAGSDSDPGKFYLFDKGSRHMTEVMPVRPQLAQVPLASVKAIRFPAADGTMIPAYLTLPPGSDGKNLPAIVLPHGGPDSHDEWGFDWLPQYFANRGYAVLQPNYRGSTGYGSAFLQKNGFHSWRTAIGDVDDGGRWLVKSGIAAADKLAIVGWSYGGYAALQSGVVDPGLFKAIVAVAPVTDLPLMVERHRNYMDYKVVQAQIGTGPDTIAGSPARNVDRIKVPVLMFQGDLDMNVPIEQSRVMESRLKSAGVTVRRIEYKGLDHQLVDNKARAELLDTSDAFLRKAMGVAG